MRVNVELPKTVIDETTSKELVRLRNENDRLRRRVEALTKNAQIVKDLKKRLEEARSIFSQALSDIDGKLDVIHRDFYE